MDEFKNAYLGLTGNPTSLDSLGILSDLEREKIALNLERIAKEKDPAERGKEEYEFYTQLKQDLAFYIGRDVKGLGATLGGVAGMERGDRFQAYIGAGLKALKEAL